MFLFAFACEQSKPLVQWNYYHEVGAFGAVDVSPSLRTLSDGPKGFNYQRVFCSSK